MEGMKNHKWEDVELGETMFDRMAPRTRLFEWRTSAWPAGYKTRLSAVKREPRHEKKNDGEVRDTDGRSGMEVSQGKADRQSG